jgi:hypothetical protein
MLHSNRRDPNATCSWLTIAFLVLGTYEALAHDRWANNDPVPDWVKASCCGKTEAHEVSSEDVHHNANEGYYTFDNGYQGKVNDKQAIPSEDGHYWIFYSCPYENCAVRCFFVPLGF